LFERHLTRRSDTPDSFTAPDASQPGTGGVNPGTYYAASAGPQAPRSALHGRVDAEVCVIGAGFAGLATAIGLIERGVRDVVIVEAETVGHGASGRNGGFVFGGFSLDCARLLAQQGPERAKAMACCWPTGLPTTRCCASARH